MTPARPPFPDYDRWLATWADLGFLHIDVDWHMPQDRQWAFEEAGHCTQFYLAGRETPRLVSIIPDGATEGRVLPVDPATSIDAVIRHYDHVPRATRALLLARHIADSLAGPAARGLACGRWAFDWQPSGDLTNVRAYARELYGLSDSPIDAHYTAVRDSLARPEVWPGVVALADALTKARELGGTRAYQILDAHLADLKSSFIPRLVGTPDRTP